MNSTLQGQTVHWIDAEFCVFMFLDSRNNSLNIFQNVSWFHFKKFPWLPRTNMFKVTFVATLFLLRVPQQANIGNCSSFCKFKRIPRISADSAYNLRIPLTICGIDLQFRIPRQLNLLNTCIFLCSWIPPTVPNSAIFVADFTNFVPFFKKLPFFRAILSNTVFFLFVRRIQNSKADKKEILRIQQQFSFWPVAESAYISQNAQFGPVM